MMAKKGRTNIKRTPHLPAVSFPIVGIGASAGGLAAIEAFFSAMRPDVKSGMAFVVVQHLDPDHKSILIDLVRKFTEMQVFKVEDGIEVQPNCAYIIPPNCDMAFLHGELRLLEPSAPRGLRLPIDFFFRSLAHDQHERAIGIVLSGTGTDGTMGLKAIKGEGGMAMVQAPESAAYDGMPRSAIATGLVDYVLPPANMPEQLIAYIRYAFGCRPRPMAAIAPKNDDILQKVYILLRAQTGHDFSLYKKNTVNRRIERRMAVAQIESIENYVRYLQQNSLEVETLFRDLLIGVTNFFRDPPAFEALKEHVIPQLFKSSAGIVRVWVPGCSTGEEAYSLAILLREYENEPKAKLRVQIFATDIDVESIEKARAGVYPDSIVADLSPERLEHFFVREESSYRIRKSIRDMVVFAKQDVIKDPPFSRMDLISCRNLLIYLGGELQKQLVPLFHYALNQDGFLLLGNSETVGEFGDIFAALDKKWRLYQRKGAVTRRAAIAPFAPPLPEGAIIRQAKPGEPLFQANARNLAEKVLLESYAPACAIVNAKFDVLYIHGHTGKYLEPAAGEASLNLLRMAREGLRLELAAAVRKVIAHNTPVRCEGLRVKSNGDTFIVNLVAQPVMGSDAASGLIMVVFADARTKTRPEPKIAPKPLAGQEQRIADLEQELGAKQEYLQAIIEELEAANEELKSTNEELQSANEELQSTNEELETAKEELQSVNEELMTVNAELQKKIDELLRITNDMNNLMASTNIGTIFIDHCLRIQRFTPAATKIVNLIQSDVGRPISDLVSRLAGYNELIEDVRAVLDALIPKERQVQTREGQWYLMRIQPYRTVENIIEGAVLTFVEITKQKEMQEQLEQLMQTTQEARDYAQNVVDTVRVPLLVLDAGFKVVSANQSFYECFQVPPEKTLGRLLYDLGDGQWNVPQLHVLLEEILPQKKTFKGFSLTHNFPTIGRRSLRLDAREIRQACGKAPLILLAIEDVTASPLFLQ